MSVEDKRDYIVKFIPFPGYPGHVMWTCTEASIEDVKKYVTDWFTSAEILSIETTYKVEWIDQE